MVRTVEMLGKNGNCKLTDTELRRVIRSFEEAHKTLGYHITLHNRNDFYSFYATLTQGSVSVKIRIYADYTWNDMEPNELVSCDPKLVLLQRAWVAWQVFISFHLRNQ